jgi:hypothetical protein
MLLNLAALILTKLVDPIVESYPTTDCNELRLFIMSIDSGMLFFLRLFIMLIDSGTLFFLLKIMIHSSPACSRKKYSGTLFFCLLMKMGSIGSSLMCVLSLRYVNEQGIMKYIKIAASLPNKTVRDVAMRCQWVGVCSF